MPHSATPNTRATDLLPWPAAGGERLELSLRGSAEAPARARRAIAALRDELGPDLLDRARLLVTELVANSVKHARSDRVGLRVVVTDDSVWTEVSDRGPGFAPTPRGFTDDPGSGWGLFLVGHLADRWGVVHDQSRTRVWFELARA
jgi:anti-sigma regulatory factor (Ser/Thr protein kinase)